MLNKPQGNEQARAYLYSSLETIVPQALEINRPILHHRESLTHLVGPYVAGVKGWLDIIVQRH
jgi:hypothetical protein